MDFPATFEPSLPHLFIAFFGRGDTLQLAVHKHSFIHVRTLCMRFTRETWSPAARSG